MYFVTVSGGSTKVDAKDAAGGSSAEVKKKSVARKGKGKSSKTDDTAVEEDDPLPPGFEFGEKIDSKIPIYDVNRTSSCICHTPIRSCLTSDPGGFSDPMNCFSYFFEELIRFVTLESNKYAISRSFKQEIICESEMTAFLGIIINSMYMKVSDRDMYWSNDRDTRIAAVADLLSRNRFKEVMRSLHFRDNQTMPSDNTDKYFKVRPLFSNLNTNLEVFENGEFISVDESIQPYFGFHGAKQYMKGKPHKFGYKMWCACAPSGIPLHCEPYAGASTEISEYGLGKCGDVVANAITRLGLDPGSQVIADNYFMSPNLLKWATEREIGLTGTLRSNRLGQIPKPVHDGAKGSYSSIIDTEQQIIYTSWQDRKSVLIGSNTYSCEPLQAVMVGKGSRRNTVQKPDLIVKYNASMGGVDLLDFWLSIYGPRIRSRKWYWPIFSWVVGVSLVASWKLWLSHVSSDEKKNNRGGFLHFIRTINHGIRGDVVERRQTRPERLLTDRNSEQRYDMIGHFVDETTSKLVCKNCREEKGIKSRTIYHCIKCKVGLHPGRCFLKYHTH